LQIHPFYSAQDYFQIVKKFPNIQICSYNPFLGIIPAEICDIFPAAHNVISKSTVQYQIKDYPSFIESLNRFLKVNHFEEIIIVADRFMRGIVSNRDNIKMKKLKLKIFDYEQDIISKL
jgi:7-cyano-7-deazaguanine tRNA-ribosyltransferase